MDDFENFLKQQPLRQPPANWRREILAAADRGAEPAPVSWWHRWLWPSPVAWAALAAIWLAIFGLNLAARSGAQPTAPREQASATSIAVAFAEKRQLLHELTEPEPAQRRATPELGPHGALTGTIWLAEVGLASGRAWACQQWLGGSLALPTNDSTQFGHC